MEDRGRLALWKTRTEWAGEDRYTNWSCRGTDRLDCVGPGPTSVIEDRTEWTVENQEQAGRKEPGPTGLQRTGPTKLWWTMTGWVVDVQDPPVCE